MLSETTHHRFVITLFLIFISITTTFAEDEEYNNQDDKNSNDNVTDDLAWIDEYSSLIPYLILIFVIVFTLHLLLYPQYATRQLMLKYLKTNISCPGKVLSYDLKEKGTNGSPDIYTVEVMYTATEHRYPDSPSMKYRFPDAFDSKNFLRRFEFSREVARGEDVECLIANRHWPRTGVPREIVERYLDGYGAYRHATAFLVGGGASLLILTGLAIREALTTMDRPAAGLVAIGMGWGASGVVSFFFAGDRFLKSKRDRFDSAKPMVTIAEQEEARVNRAPVDLAPSWKGFHNFAGHARADLELESGRKIRSEALV